MIPLLPQYPSPVITFPRDLANTPLPINPIRSRIDEYLKSAIHTSDAETYRTFSEIVEELKIIEAEAQETDEALRKTLKHLGVSV